MTPTAEMIFAIMTGSSRKDGTRESDTRMNQTLPFTRSRPSPKALFSHPWHYLMQRHGAATRRAGNGKGVLDPAEL
jgi:hypothetical protein